MIILGIDTTTLSCSVALLREDSVLAEMTLNIKKTHSERLMPLLDRMLTESGIEREALDAIAAAAGPGSFTGLRIGVSTARALAQALQIPAVPVCTLAALAAAIPVPGALVCPLLDARRNQVYTALYRIGGAASDTQFQTCTPPGPGHHPEALVTESPAKQKPETPARTRQVETIAIPAPHQTLLEPTAIAISELIENLVTYQEPVIFTGEGLQSHAAFIQAGLPSAQAVITPAPFRHCRAALVAQLGRQILTEEQPAGYETLLPIYLRRPEAERLAAKKQGGHRQ